MSAEKISVKAKVKEPYYNAAGVRVPRVTTICNLRDKSHFLVPWAYNCGRDGIDYEKLREDLADVGTLAHEFVIQTLLEIRDRDVLPPVDVSEYTPFQAERATRCFDSGLNWIQKRRLKPFLLEHKVISEIYQFGGRLDYLGDVDGLFTLADFKTGKWAYDEYFVQLAGYDLGLAEDEDFLKIGRRIDQYMIVNLPRTEGEKFQVQVRRSISLQVEKFKHLRAIYEIEKKLAKRGRL